MRNLLTSYWQIVLLPQKYLLFFAKREYGLKNAILVTPYNNVVRIEDTVLK